MLSLACLLVLQDSSNAPLLSSSQQQLIARVGKALTGYRPAVILNQMVSRSSTLDRTFGAIADPTRRALLERLRRQRPLSVSELARPFPVSLPAILKHLNVLAAAGLVICDKSGRTVTCRLNARPMKGAMQWMGQYERYWFGKLDRLAAFVEAEGDE